MPTRKVGPKVLNKNNKEVSKYRSEKGHNLNNMYGQYWRKACKQFGYGVKNTGKGVAPAKGTNDYIQVKRQYHQLRKQAGYTS